MQIKQLAFWAVFFEVAAYMVVARMALSGVKKVEQNGYDSNVRVPEVLNWKTSLTVMKLMRDFDLPRAGYPDALKWKIYIARTLFFIYPVAFLGLLFVLLFAPD